MSTSGFEMRAATLAAVVAALFTAVSTTTAMPPDTENYGRDPLDAVRNAVAHGERRISVPAGRHFLSPREGDIEYLKLEGVSDVIIDFNGAELVGSIRTRMLSFANCTNVTVRNLTIDYEPLPFTQGRIEEVGPNGEWVVRILGGYPCPSSEAAKAHIAWPIQAYNGQTLELKNPMRFRDGIALEKTGEDTYRISGGLDRRGDVGDIAVFSCAEEERKTESGAVKATRCVNLTLENVTVYATPGGPGFFDMLSERMVYRNCRLVPRPPETDLQKREIRRLRSGNQDAFMSRGAIVGPQIIGCTALYHCDDCVNIGGKYAVVVSAKGRTLRLLADGIGASIAAGDSLQIFLPDGSVLPDVFAESVAPAKGRTPEELAFLKAQGFWPSLAESCSRALTLTLDRELDIPVGSLVANRNHTGDGFLVRGCRFGRNRSRGLILQASDGVVEDNFIDHPLDIGMKLSMSHLWLEGSCGSNVRVVRNRIEKDGSGIGIYVGGTPGENGAEIPADAHRDLAFEDNEILDVATGISVTGCTGLSLKGNRIRTASPKDQPVVLKNVANVDGSGGETESVSATQPRQPVDWSDAWLSGSLDRDCPFFALGEEMVFSLRLEGAKGDIPADEYCVDWERRGDDGIVEKGRAPLPTGNAPLVIRTKMNSPGFVCVEANVVDSNGKRVKKDHRWEPRVFFMGGAAVAPETLRPGTEPADYDAFWNAQMAALNAVPIEAELTPTPCADTEVRLYAVLIPCTGGRPVTGWLTMPADASPEKRYPFSVGFRGATMDDQPAPGSGPHTCIQFISNGHGFDLGRGPEYVKEFFASVCKPGFGYGFDPDSNKHRETSYWLGMALRAIRSAQWATTLPEWDGETLVLDGTSQGGWQALMAAARCPRVTKVKTGITWGCDWTGQEEFRRLPSNYRPKCWFPDMAYFDAVFAAKRIHSPVEINRAGLGDYVSPPSSLAVLYNALAGSKKIVWRQGWTHGWSPSGMSAWTIENR